MRRKPQRCSRDGIAMMPSCSCRTRSRCSRRAASKLWGPRSGPISDAAMALSLSRSPLCSPQAAPFTPWTATARRSGAFRRRTTASASRRIVGTSRTGRPFADLDGILMANSLHYVADPAAFIRACESRMASRRRFLIVEYDTTDASRWVPFPVSQSRLATLFASAGYSSTVLCSRPSVYRRASLYAAAVVTENSAAKASR